MKIFNAKPSDVRKSTVAALVTIAAVIAFAATFTIGMPQVAAGVAIVSTVVNGLLAFLSREDVIKEIAELDDKG